VARSMWAWMFALIPDLRTRYPDLAQAVISGDPVRSPDDLRLLVAATSSLRIWVCGQDGGFAVRGRLDGRDGHESPSGLWAPGPEMVAVPRIAVSSPPFVVLLADSGDDVRANYFDTREWLEEDARSVRPVSLLLPMVRAFDADGPVTLVTYEELASAA
jgi:hypothetical protein